MVYTTSHNLPPNKSIIIMSKKIMFSYIKFPKKFPTVVGGRKPPTHILPR